MKILKEAKEELPISFLTNFVSRSWDSVGELKEDIAAIKKEFKSTDKVEKILNDLIDSYLVCIGQMELLLNHKDYLNIPDKKDNNLKENIQDIKVINDLIKDEVEAIDGYKNAKEKINNKEAEDLFDHIESEEVEHIKELSNVVDAFNCDFDTPVGDKITDADLYGTESQKMKPEPVIEVKKSVEPTDVDIWNCDFDEPVGTKLTDKDLYPED